jgi:hypothetical protein
VESAVIKGRSAIQALMTDTCQIFPSVAGTPGSQGAARTWPTSTATVVCTVQGPRTSPSGEIDNTMLPYHHLVKMPYGTVIAPADHIEWVEGGITLEVLDEARRTGSNSMAQSVATVEVD